MATIEGSKKVFPSRVSELPGAYQAMARSLQPALEKATERFSPFDVVRIVMAAIGEQFAGQPKRQTGLAMALMRGAAAREEIKEAEGGSLSAEEAGTRLGISKTAILKRYQKGQLLGWREAKQNAVRFPVWQFTEDNVLPGLSEVLGVFQDAEWLDDWGRIVFLLTPLGSMKGKRPLDLLRNGKTRPVIGAAQAYLE